MSDLRRKLAEAAGWTVQEIAGSYWCFNPQGTAFDCDLDEDVVWALIPDYLNDDGACLDALDAIVARSTVAEYALVSKWTKNERGCECTIIEYDTRVVTGRGATRREAMIAALAAYYQVEVT